MNHLIKLPTNAAGLTIVSRDGWRPGEPFAVYFMSLEELKAGRTARVCIVVYPAGNPADEPEVIDLKL